MTTEKKKPKKMNDFMKAKEKARKANADEFEYTNKDGEKKVYKKTVTATGMVIYRTTQL
jgi:hypothetical protein